MSNIKDFGQAAIKMSKNPLGIIGLMFVLVYGIAGVVSISSTFKNDERYIITWFLVLFPVLVVLVFFRLVTKHHSKLCAPSDFSNEENFVGLINNQIANSPKVMEIESLMTSVQEQINNQPLYKYTKLSEAGKIIALFSVKGESVDLKGLVKEGRFGEAEVNDQSQLLIQYGWVEIKDDKASVTEKGREEIMTFEDLAYGRLK